MRPQYLSWALVLPLLAGAFGALAGCSERRPPAPLVTVSPAAPRAVVSVRSLGTRETFVRDEPEVKPRRRRRRARRRETPKPAAAPVAEAVETAPAAEPEPATVPAPLPEPRAPAPAPVEPEPAPSPEPQKDPGVGTASFFYGSAYDPYRLNLPSGRRRTR